MGSAGRGNRYRHLHPAISCMVVCLVLFPAVYGQDSLPEIEITLSSRNRTLNELLEEITLQTGYYFTYNADLINGKEKVRFEGAGVGLEYALDSLLNNPRLSYRIIDRNIVIYQRNLAAPTPISNEIDRALLKGKVLDSRSGDPLSYSTIALYGTNLGSITNQEGEFSFKVPDSIADPLLVISYMGYRQKIMPVHYPIEEDLIIEMEREMISLQEVIIRFADPEQLLLQALEKIPDQYLDDYSTMTAFYRESVKRNEHYMLYSEAVLDVAKAPYSQDFTSDRVHIRKARKITDVSVEDTVLVKLRSGIYAAIDLDVIKNRPDFLLRDFVLRYDLELNDLMSLGGELVYVIGFKQKEGIADLLFKGELYLDYQDLTLIAADFEFNPELIHKEPGLFLVSGSPSIRIRPVYARYHVEYRALSGKYILSQVRGGIELKVRKRRRWIGSSYTISLEMAITDVIPGQRLRIAPAERVNPNLMLSDEPFESDPAFWGIHNTIEPEASLMESIQRLEHSLQEISE